MPPSDLMFNSMTPDVSQLRVLFRLLKFETQYNREKWTLYCVEVNRASHWTTSLYVVRPVYMRTPPSRCQRCAVTRVSDVDQDPRIMTGIRNEGFVLCTAGCPCTAWYTASSVAGAGREIGDTCHYLLFVICDITILTFISVAPVASIRRCRWESAVGSAIIFC